MKSIEEQTKEAAKEYLLNVGGDFSDGDFIAGAEWERNRDKWNYSKERPPKYETVSRTTKTKGGIMDYFKEENDIVREIFDLDDILTFQLYHDVQIIRGSDYQYQCFIDGKVYELGLTHIGALWHGINTYKQKR